MSTDSESESDSSQHECTKCHIEVVYDINDYNCQCSDIVWCQNCFFDNCVSNEEEEGYCIDCFDPSCIKKVSKFYWDLNEEQAERENNNTTSNERKFVQFANFVENYVKKMNEYLNESREFSKVKSLRDLQKQLDIDFEKDVKKYDYHPFSNEEAKNAGRFYENFKVSQKLKKKAIATIKHKGFQFEIFDFGSEGENKRFFLQSKQTQDFFKNNLNKKFHSGKFNAKYVNEPKQGYLFTGKATEEELCLFLKSCIDKVKN